MTEYEPANFEMRDTAQEWSGEAPETEHERRVRLIVALRKMGVSERVCGDLVFAFPLDHIEQQIEWLPFRRAKRKSSLIVAAIKGDYERPAALEEPWGEEEA